MDKPKHTNRQEDFLPDLPNYDPEPVDGMGVGDSPTSGLTLRCILRGHSGVINRIAWSPDGRLLASPSKDSTIRIWDVAGGRCVAVLEGQTSGTIEGMAWSPDGTMLVSGGFDKTVRVWNIATHSLHRTLKGHASWVNDVTWSPHGVVIASVISNDTTLGFGMLKKAPNSTQFNTNIVKVWPTRLMVRR
jgi:WD40 repeat protein